MPTTRAGESDARLETCLCWSPTVSWKRPTNTKASSDSNGWNRYFAILQNVLHQRSSKRLSRLSHGTEYSRMTKRCCWFARLRQGDKPRRHRCRLGKLIPEWSMAMQLIRKGKQVQSRQPLMSDYTAEEVGE